MALASQVSLGSRRFSICRVAASAQASTVFVFVEKPFVVGFLVRSVVQPFRCAIPILGQASPIYNPNSPKKCGRDLIQDRSRLCCGRDLQAGNVNQGVGEQGFSLVLGGREPCGTLPARSTSGIGSVMNAAEFRSCPYNGAAEVGGWFLLRLSESEGRAGFGFAGTEAERYQPDAPNFQRKSWDGEWLLPYYSPAARASAGDC
jgi:hypothetical protein